MKFPGCDDNQYQHSKLGGLILEWEHPESWYLIVRNLDRNAASSLNLWSIICLNSCGVVTKKGSRSLLERYFQDVNKVGFCPFRPIGTSQNLVERITELNLPTSKAARYGGVVYRDCAGSSAMMVTVRFQRQWVAIALNDFRGVENEKFCGGDVISTFINPLSQFVLRGKEWESIGYMSDILKKIDDIHA